MGHAVDQSLLSLVKELITKYKRTEADQSAIQGSLVQQRTEQIEIQNTVAYLQDQHDEQLEVFMEWKEQQMKENKGILQKLVAVEKTLSEELLNRVQGVEESLGGVEESLGGVEESLGGVEERLGGVEESLGGVISQTDERVKQLEENVRDLGMKDERAEASPMETFDVKTCRSKLAEHYKRTAKVPTSVGPKNLRCIFIRSTLDCPW
ncbi:hypothetical protein OS493_020540 [Desmophyllum pertusum]|uniref:Uncharacterized protein n=1 Tax=Desmophyllum pertusum TaxID=174260 RepID=A0A9W9YZ96_9CNID|nr:hypothetical protein OS493_020540 [Desmophyllum pertusum]